jgi:hypothetical protein
VRRGVERQSRESLELRNEWASLGAIEKVATEHVEPALMAVVSGAVDAHPLASTADRQWFVDRMMFVLVVMRACRPGTIYSSYVCLSVRLSSARVFFLSVPALLVLSSLMLLPCVCCCRVVSFAPLSLYSLMCQEPGGLGEDVP